MEATVASHREEPRCGKFYFYYKSWWIFITVIKLNLLEVQLVDARNPLLFYCADLFRYVKEIDPLKKNILLINKADLLTKAQR
jgi:large subunit GTPase 1